MILNQDFTSGLTQPSPLGEVLRLDRGITIFAGQRRDPFFNFIPFPVAIAGALAAGTFPDLAALFPPTDSFLNNSVRSVLVEAPVETTGFRRLNYWATTATVAVAQAPGQAGIAGPTTVGCGGGYPECAKSDRNIFNLLAATIAPVGCNINPGQGNEFWTVVLPKTIIAIPTLNGRINTSAAGNLSSPHAIVCLNS
jgi:hypothetical protein